jgi:uncharacterized YigZ family protein
MDRCVIPAQETRTEIRVVNSRFIATVAPALTVEEARAFIARVKREFSDATHNVPAYLIGHGSSVIAHCSDDGEPSGTAGHPMLAVLRGSDLGDVAVVVTRYFGGTKLGTGGLVRAYGDAVRACLDDLPRAVKVPTHTVMVAVPYSLFERLRRLIAGRGGKVLDEEFGADVTVTAQIIVDEFPDFQRELRELSHGAVEAEIVETNAATIMPLASPAGEAS